MTTDITELAQRMRTAAEKAGIEQWVNNRGEVNTADYEVDGGMYIDHICDCEIVGTESPRAEFIALANPANIIALVEALEKAQQRITQMESRTVNISVPDARNEDYDWDGQTPSEAFNTCRTICFLTFKQSLRAAGIKVEAE
ncbi:TPA: ead/Ea22-like family protein [Klebsiella pneumoniae]|uniref:ead/Ea22-like family protein n=1 Tax=Klebsiella pneumoniae TaxID=573 RepID=UPI00080916BC|nr:ead/Ea22-like family protein [Klebsiella pneumoniae]MCE7336644.1 ead/Ea22-like family protein [Klebsiella pneumoniae]MCE7372949.1 ead/Ea22-like family protein [Klebsiella pneumoniae]MCQ8363079.1 ead/Ea22-like family protein [Klebsiella pneumoniae]MCQ8373469.1 ead/Ea22-like family protein [Klebsiella pneumoniae]MCQ8489051.1 ead/Ea22-like family protein [Klebsiella pneumoniae]